MGRAIELFHHEPVSFSVSLQMNDYMAAYHDAVLLIGQVMREIVETNHSEVHQMEFVHVNNFRNISFSGKEGERGEISSVLNCKELLCLIFTLLSVRLLTESHSQVIKY